MFNFLGPNTLGQTAMMVIAFALIGFGLMLLVCWIIYWVQMAQYGRRLREGRGGYGYHPGSLEEDYDDEYRGRRPRLEDEEDDYDRPSRHRVADDEDDRPRRRREDDDEDEPPRRRARDDY